VHPFKDLTRRDLEILRLLGEGYSLLQIADAIGARTADLIRIAIEHQISVRSAAD
jgi:DNA-binding CsgD family transcriptional regulator